MLSMKPLQHILPKFTPVWAKSKVSVKIYTYFTIRNYVLILINPSASVNQLSHKFNAESTQASAKNDHKEPQSFSEENPNLPERSDVQY